MGKLILNCNATFSSNFNRNKHERKFNHHEEPPCGNRSISITFDDEAKVYKCNNQYCKVTSKKKHNMVRHITSCSAISLRNNIHKSNKVCSICGMEFLKKFNRDRHYKTVHTDELSEDVAEDSAFTSVF